MSWQHDKCVIWPLVIRGAVENTVRRDMIDRGRVAPAVGAFADETALEHADTVPVADGVIGDGEQQRKLHGSGGSGSGEMVAS